MNTLSQYLTQTKTSQADFAAMISRDQTLVSRLARGLVSPTVETAQRIANATSGKVPISSWPKYAEIAAAMQSGDAA